MNILSTVSEIGILETLHVVSQYEGGSAQVALYLPPMDFQYIENRTQELANTLITTGKPVLFLMLPEIALLEKLAEAKWGGDAILALPFDMDEESKERIYANIPEGISTTFIEEGAYPSAFRPDNGAVVCTGIAPNEFRQYLPYACCRMMSLYKVFQGERILLSCFPRNTRVPEIGWSYTEKDYFNRIIEEVV
jgi:hypothetical protein